MRSEAFQKPCIPNLEYRALFFNLASNYIKVKRVHRAIEVFWVILYTGYI
jgi:hypothetical protein